MLELMRIAFGLDSLWIADDQPKPPGWRIYLRTTTGAAGGFYSWRFRHWARDIILRRISRPRRQFEPGTSYTIDTLPDDLHDKSKLPGEKWAICDALFWNDCQGWWIQSIADYHLAEFGAARFWQPLPRSPMPRKQILAERGLVICRNCDLAIELKEPHVCRPSEGVLATKAKIAAGQYRRAGADDD